jgi:hypothetical protein
MMTEDRGGRDNGADGDNYYYYSCFYGGLDHTPLSRLANSYRLERDRTEVEGVRTEVESMEVGGEYPE